MKYILSILSLLFLVSFINAQPRINMKYQIQRCMDVGGVPVQGCWVYTDGLGRQYYITSQQAIDSLLDSGLRDTIIAYGGGVSGLTEDEVLYGTAGGTIDQDAGFRRIGTDSTVIDSALQVNGAVNWNPHVGGIGLVPTSVSVLRGGILEFNANPDTTGVRYIMQIKSLKQNDSVPNFNMVLGDFSFDGVHNPTVSLGFNAGLNAGRENTGIGGMYDNWEGNFANSPGQRFGERHLVGRNISGVSDRVYSFIYDTWNRHATYGYFTLGTFFMNDTYTGNPFASINRVDSSGADIRLFASESGQTEGVVMQYNNNAFTLSPIGTPFRLYSTFDNTNVKKLRIETDWGTTDGSSGDPAYLYGGEANYGGVVRVPFQEAADSISQYITFDLPEGFDSIVTCANGDFGFIINGDTTCISVDSVWIIQPCVYGISLGDTVSVCVPEGTPGLNIYNANGSLSNTPGGVRLVDLDTAAIRFRRGTIDRVVINREALSSTLMVQAGTSTNDHAIEVRGNNLETSNASITFNGLTDGTHQRDYTIGLNPGGSGIFQMSASNLLTVNPWLQYHGFLDSLVLLSGVQFDGIIYDAAGDQGATGDVLVAQANGTVLWTAGGAGGDNIYTTSDAIADEDRNVFVQNANDLTFELDSITGAGAEFNIRHENGDTLFRVEAVGGGSVIELGMSSFPPLGNGFPTINGVTTSHPTATGVVHGFYVDRPTGGDVLFGVFSSLNQGDSLVLINEGLANAPGNPNAFLEFDTDLNQTKAPRTFQFSQGLKDKDGDLGSAGQVLTSTGAGQVDWAAAGGAGVSFGTDNQIPFTNSTTDDFDYSANFTMSGTAFGVDNSDVVFNESGTDSDFRVESDNQSFMFFVDASLDRVGIGTAPQTILHINRSTGATLPFVEIENTSTGDASIQFSIAGDAYVLGIDNSDNDLFKFSYAPAQGTAVAGTNDLLTIAPTGFASPATTLTLGVGATTFALTSNVMTITSDAGGNTIATITAGISGQILTLIFVDALTTITDTGTGASNTVNLSAAFTSAANTTITLVNNGTSWFETSRSTN